MSKIVIRTAEIVRVHEELSRRLTRHEGETCSYIDAADSDESVAQTIGRISAGHVKRIRLELFGTLTDHAPTPLDNRVSRLELRMARVEELLKSQGIE